ncbi:hypothetical protein LOC71_04220 [Rhodopirellula sp. JC740]|uniref:Uncharacterized protein n=1 Tax=Rhodopirellula halodulae TaxID=2894198 RepID=A0ABS8NEW2_9BACT|nr:hypothetical protein [Rhodopirellula sp. JC740]MCC9641467.1 hypothetical protein [Rhodopirellula sp. JC740]
MARDDEPNELEAFLRRSAEIRQRNAVEFQAMEDERRRQRSGSRPRAYSDRRRERITEQLIEAMDVTVEDDHGGHDVVLGEVIEESDAGADLRGDTLRQQAATKPRSKKGASSAGQGGDRQVFIGQGATPIENLRRLLTQRGGAQQAFLMSEILKRRQF